MSGLPDNVRCAELRHANSTMTSERLRALVEATSDWIWEVDEMGVYTFTSPKVHDLLGYEPAEVLGRKPFDFMAPSERERLTPIFADLVRTHSPIRCLENVNMHKDGREVVLETSAVPLFRDDGSVCGYRGIDRDITLRKAAEVALKQAKEAAEDANRAKDTFLALVSHELRAPLAPLLGVVNALEEMSNLSQELHNYAAVIRRNVEMEARLVDDLLDIGRIARGKIELRRAPVDVHEQISHLLHTCQGDIDGKPLQLHLQLRASHTRVDADPTRFQQILLNVLRNAIKFTAAGGAVTIATENPVPEKLDISVTDTGIGIPPETLPRIFDAFEQGGREMTRRFGGLGLGLAITRALTQNHHGTITAHSDGPGKGATFTLTFPTSTKAAVATPPPAAISRRQYRILVVDDNTDTLHLLAKLLTGRRHAVHTATSIADAMASVAEHPVDLVISDIGLPDGSGTELMQQLRARGITRGIAFSGYGTDADVQNSLDAGFHAHLTKPVDFKVLLEQMEAAMNESAP